MQQVGMRQQQQGQHQQLHVLVEGIEVDEGVEGIDVGEVEIVLPGVHLSASTTALSWCQYQYEQ